ncbi:MAG: PAS domain S-box protein, partial [Deltaproteobacteria bacterium]|nr:PAS domain S-box protein [Deltaproteobacteria bacterium]
MDDKRSKILEEELKASQERRYRDLFERVRHGLFVSTKDGRFIDCNQAMLDMLGYESKEEFLSINIEKDLYVNPEDRRRFQREIEEKGYVKDYEINFKKKTGEEISVLVTCNSLLDNKGEVIGYQGLNIDITERKRMEREVREATKRFQKISEMGDDGIIVFDQVYQIEFANMMAVDITGFSQEELMGMDFNLLLNERDQKFLADMHSEVGEDENRRLCLEMEINTAAGGSKEVEVCITIAKGEGRGLRTYAYIRDITLRKKMEREIREANEFLSKMIESSVNCVVATDMKGDILIFNKGAEKLLGYKTEEVVGKMSIRNVYPPGVAKEVMEKMRSPDYGEVGRLESLPMVHKNRKGEAIDGSLSASIIYDNKGNEIATVGIFTDLRPRLKMEERLREAQQQLLQSEKLAAMGRLTSQVAHELNNPIYGIMNTLELLKTEIPSDSKRRRILDLSLSETQRLSEMLRSMLSFSKPQEEVRRKIDINRLIEDILLFLEKQLRESNVKIKTKLNQNISHITASPNQIRQVILNIAANAKEAMPKGGTLTVETLSKNNQIVIKIRDTGVGIPGEIRDKIFDAFFTTKQKIKGVGLGLSVCYGIIKDHGGDIRVKSKTGEGSTFSIILPQKPSS